MMDAATVPRVAEVMIHRVAYRLQVVLEEDPATLEKRLSDLDGWTLAALLRLTRVAAGERIEADQHHLGVVGVDHSLNQLVVGESCTRVSVLRDLNAIDLDQLDDEDLIAASRYVPETLPGYVLG